MLVIALEAECSLSVMQAGVRSMTCCGWRTSFQHLQNTNMDSHMCLYTHAIKCLEQQALMGLQCWAGCQDAWWGRYEHDCSRHGVWWFKFHAECRKGAAHCFAQAHWQSCQGECLYLNDSLCKGISTLRKKSRGNNNSPCSSCHYASHQYLAHACRDLWLCGLVNTNLCYLNTCVFDWRWWMNLTQADNSCQWAYPSFHLQA